MPFTQRSSAWTAERIDKLAREEIQQLAANARTLGALEVAALCDAALAARPKGRGASAAGGAKRRHLVSRSKAFEARGVYLQDARTSWGGVRKSDGTVVLTLWADAVKSRDGGCAYLLWAPNVDGAHPWSDSAGGRERLEHCRLALAGAAAEALLVFGERLEGHAPEEKARSVHGVDPQAVVRFTVEKQGEEYWAVWGKKTGGADGIANN